MQQAAQAALLVQLNTGLQAVATARSNYTTAQSELNAATAQRAQAAAAAKDAGTRAAAAAQNAKTAAAAFVYALHAGTQTADGALQGIFGHPDGSLLQRLGSLSQLSKLDGTAKSAASRADAAAKDASRLATLAHHAQAAVAAVPVAAKQHAVAAAKAALDAAQSAVTAIQAQLASGAAFGVNPAASAAGAIPSGTWVNPVVGPITDIFGPRPSQPAGSPVFHPGDDIGASCGTVILAAGGGTVVSTGPNGGYGNWVEIDDGSGIDSVYGHLLDGSTIVSPGQQVSAGQPIGQVGSTGMSTGCHLHMEIRLNGSPIDPMPFFAARGITLGR